MLDIKIVARISADAVLIIFIQSFPLFVSI